MSIASTISYPHQKYKCSENGNELFRSLFTIPFTAEWNDVKTNTIKNEVYNFGEIAEIQASSNDITYAVLDLIFQFAGQFKEAIIIHISIGNNLQISLKQSNFIITGDLESISKDGRFKTITTQSILQLISSIELLKSTLNGEKCLVIFDKLDPLLLAQKSLNSSLSSTSLLQEFFRSIKRLQEEQQVILLWLSIATPRSKGGIRDGIPRDIITTLWREKITRNCFYNRSI